jgi:hypothetical protein
MGGYGEGRAESSAQLPRNRPATAEFPRFFASAEMRTQALANGGEVV